MKYVAKILNFRLQIVPYNQKWKLFISEDGEEFIDYSTLPSAVALADDVFTQSTGCDQFDWLDDIDDHLPTDLWEWKKITS